MSEFLNWIDKDLKEISTTTKYKDYFENIEIVKGEDTFYLTNKNMGIEIIMPVNLTIDTIHFFSEGYQNNKEFTGTLPFELKFSFSRDKIHEILNIPNKNGGGYSAPNFGYIANWDKYYYDNFSLHFRYSNDYNSIDMLTIGSLKLEEYFTSEQQ